MNRAWSILIIGAVVDGCITGITGVMAVLTVPILAADGSTIAWAPALLLVPILGGLLQTFRTIQTALANTSTFMAELRGLPVVTTTTLPGQTIVKTPTATLFATPHNRPES